MAIKGTKLSVPPGFKSMAATPKPFGTGSSGGQQLVDAFRKKSSSRKVKKGKKRNG